MIRRLPDLSLVGGDRDAVRPDEWIDSAKLGVCLVVPDELPLPLEGLEVDVGLAAVLFVHQQQRVQSFHLYPPFF